MTAVPPENPPPHWTLAGFRQGAIAVLPMMPGLFVFGMAFGTVAARKGFSLFDALIMNATVFSGVVQMVVIETWPERLTLSAIAGIAAVTAMINLRFVLISASLRPWLGSQPAAKVYPMFFLLTEPIWLLSMRYRANGGNDPCFLLGGGVVIYFVWLTSAIPGYWLGANAGDPYRYGLDLVMPAFFTAMMVSLWQGPRRAIGWLVAGAVAIVTEQLFGGLWYVMAGSLAGSLVGGFIDDSE